MDYSPPDPTSVSADGQSRSMAGILTARAYECVRTINLWGRVRLLAEPSFDRGAVEPEVVLRRLATWARAEAPRDPEPFDIEVAA
jgi:hypothetical protein